MNITRRVYALAVAGLLVLAGVQSAAAQTFVDDAVKTAGAHHVIITVTPGHEGAVRGTLQRRGAKLQSEHPSINGFAATIRNTDLADLAKSGAVAVTPDMLVHATGAAKSASSTSGVKLADFNTQSQPESVSTLRLSLGLNAGAAANLTSGVNGSGVGIAIIDSGIAPNADFTNASGKSRITGWKDYVNNKQQPYDDLGHGTHIAGLVASSGALTNYMFQGIAPNANLVAIKVLDKNGASSTSRVIAAIEYVVTHRTQLGVQAINLSLGHPITAPAKFDPLVQAVEDAVRHGLVVIVAAGNDGPGYASVNSPANSPSAISVGAVSGKTTVTRDDDYVTSFSSRGPTWYDGFAKPDVVAPGVNLYSDAAPGSTLVKSTDPAFPQNVAGMIDLSGTSMSAAVATGVVALELDANLHQNQAPLTPNAAKAILEYTAITVANADHLTQGAGQINAAGAAQLAAAVNTTAPVNSWWLQAGVAGTSTIGGKTYNWAKNIIWGTAVIGGRVIFYNNLMWDDNIIWGTGVVRGSNIVRASKKSTRAKFYDDNIIWGTDVSVIKKNIVWATDGGDNIIWGTSLTKFRVVGEKVGKTIVWGNDDVDNIIWGTLDADNIIWGTDDGDNIIWGTWDGDNIIWGTTADDNIIWGTSDAEDNIIWGTSAKKGALVNGKSDDNIIWGTAGRKVVRSLEDGDNIIWGTADIDNIIWGTSDDNIIWGTDDGDNIIWGTEGGDNIIWGTEDGDNIIWGTSVGGLQ